MELANIGSVASMSELISLVEKSLEELEREITCAICQDHYTEPKVLPCLHYYCKQCIYELALRIGTDKPFSCPECRKEAILPEGSVDQLTTAFIINRLKASFATLEQAHGKVEVKCEACTDSGAKAEDVCRQCAMLVCKECIKSHLQMKTCNAQKLVCCEDLKQGEAKRIVVKEPRTKKCADHKKSLRVFCFDCGSLICRDCTVKDHRDHNFEFCKIAAPSTKRKLMEKLEPLREVEVSLSHAVEEIQTTKHELEAQGDSVANTIETSFQELHQILEKRKHVLLEEAGRIVREKIDKLLLQEKNLSLASAEVQSVVDSTERCVRHCADNEVMSMHTEISSRIEQEIEEHSKPGRIMEPMEEVDVGVEVKCAEALQQLCQTKTNLTRFCFDPVKCTVIVERAKTVAEVNKISVATLTVRLTNNMPMKHLCKVDCQLKSLCNGSVINCNVDRTGAGKYSIQYTPTVRGRHKLTVSVDGQQVAGSPFTVFVSIPPTQLGKPVRVWGGIAGPTGITVNSVGEIIVTERCGNMYIIVFDKEGKRLRSIEHSQHKLNSLFGAAVDGEDNIYCTDSYTNKIFRCNKNGDNIQVYEVKQVKGPGHYGVAVVGDEVMVCERYNKGSIMVYDRELKYVRQIVGRDMGELHDLSPDSHGNLYVTDCDKSCIRVFSNEGDFLRTFGCDLNVIKKLNTPYYVCVAGQYVYITDDGNCNVSVFTTEGEEYVTSFGQEGSKEGDFSYPCGVCVDKDGFVYVAELTNKLVQIF